MVINLSNDLYQYCVKYVFNNDYLIIHVFILNNLLIITYKNNYLIFKLY